MGSKSLFPLFVSVPHSGIKIPPEADWLKNFSPRILACDIDAFVDKLYAPALKEFQIPSVIFKWHRYSIDANRFAENISPATVEGASLPRRAGKYKSSSDIHWHKTTKGDLLIKKPLPQKLHKILIKKYFNPFHQKIERRIGEFKKAGWRSVYLLDLHSMPSKGLAFHRDPGGSRPDIVLSDCEGRSCSKAFRNLALRAYKEAGFKTALNWPYKGGAIAQRYGRPPMGLNSLQAELNRKLYMNETTKEKSAGYKKVQARLKKAIAFIAQNYHLLEARRAGKSEP